MFKTSPAVGAKGSKRVEGVKLSRNANTALSKVVGTAAGLFGGVQSWIWDKGTDQTRHRDIINFSAFEDIAFDPKKPNHRTPSLLIGYHNGFQIWDMSKSHQDSHAITEIISKQWDGSVKLMTVVQSFEDFNGNEDEFAKQRPFLAIASESPKYRGMVTLYSIPTGAIRTIALEPDNEEITDMFCNGSILAVGTTKHKIHLICLETLQIKRTIVAWQDPDSSRGPVFTLGPRWLAFQSGAPINGETDSSHLKRTKKRDDEHDMSANQKDTKEHGSNQNTWTKQEMLALGYHSMKEAMYQGSKMLTSVMQSYNGEPSSQQALDPNAPPGTIEVWSIHSARLTDNRFPRIAIFSADKKRIERMAFDRPGLLLATAPDGGQSVKIWNLGHIVAHHSPAEPVSPMYILERGATLGSISNIVFNESSSLVAFTTRPKGTTHLFPINLVGTEVGVDTHTPDRIPVSLPLADVSTKQLRPPKLAAIHSPSESNPTFAGVTRLISYPLTTSHSDLQRTKHAHDHTLFGFYPDGSLIRQDIRMKATQTGPNSQTLVADIRPRHRWELVRHTVGWAEFPTFKPNDDPDLQCFNGASPEHSHASPIDPSDLLSNVETTTHAFDRNNSWWQMDHEHGMSSLPKVQLFAWTELPPDYDPSTLWRNDKLFDNTPKIQLHTPGLPGIGHKQPRDSPSHAANNGPLPGGIIQPLVSNKGVSPSRPKPIPPISGPDILGFGPIKIEPKKPDVAMAVVQEPPKDAGRPVEAQQKEIAVSAPKEPIRKEPVVVPKEPVVVPKDDIIPPKELLVPDEPVAAPSNIEQDPIEPHPVIVPEIAEDRPLPELLVPIIHEDQIMEEIDSRSNSPAVIEGVRVGKKKRRGSSIEARSQK